jgi:hypothetical protein
MTYQRFVYTLTICEIHINSYKKFINFAIEYRETRFVGSWEQQVYLIICGQLDV